MGVFHPDLVGIQVRALQRLGAQARARGVGKRRHGRDIARRGNPGGRAARWRSARVRDPAGGFRPADGSSRNLSVDDAKESKTCCSSALNNKPGVPREIVTLNAGTALYAADVVIDRSRHGAGERDDRERTSSRKSHELVRFTQQFAN